MTALPLIADSDVDQEKLKELMSIARLISYARQSAENVNAVFPVQCLDMALAAILQEIDSTGQQQARFVDFDEDISMPIQCH